MDRLALSYLIAWFSATQSAKTNQSIDGDQLSVSDPNYTISSLLELPVKVDVVRVTNNTDNLELAHWFSSADSTGTGTASTHDAGLVKGIWDQNHTYLTYSSSAKGAGYALFTTYKITAQVDTDYNDGTSSSIGSWNGDKTIFTDKSGGQWTVDQIAEKLNGELVTISLTRKDHTSTGDSRAMFYSFGTSSITVAPASNLASTAQPSATPTAVETDLSGLYDFVSGNAGPKEAKTIEIAYFGLYVEGENDQPGNLDEANSTVYADFEVTLSHRDA